MRCTTQDLSNYVTVPRSEDGRRLDNAIRSRRKAIRRVAKRERANSIERVANAHRDLQISVYRQRDHMLTMAVRNLIVPNSRFS